MSRAMLTLCVLGLLANATGAAANRTDAAAAPAARSGAPPSRAVPPRAIRSVSVAPRPVSTPVAAAHAAAAAARAPATASQPAPHYAAPHLSMQGTAAARLPTHPLMATAGRSRGSHLPLNSVLGGPATFDARKLVRR